MYQFESYTISDDMLGAIERYLEYGIPPGEFLQAVLANKFVEACGAADHHNRYNLPAFAAFLYNEMPMNSWGSAEKVRAWMAAKQAEATSQRDIQSPPSNRWPEDLEPNVVNPAKE